MLKAKALEQVLAQAVGGGIASALLLTPDGSVVSSAPPLPPRGTAVLSSNIWHAFDRLGARLSRGSPVAAPSTSPASPADAPGPAFSVGELGVLLMADEGGKKIGMARTGGKMVVVAVADPDVPFAVLKSKVLGLADYLEVPLNQVNR
ncbi:hypothetical protein DFJ74DRAFT_765941 [Hyaloraphidium curvatum]|nr:hypothetical protein DFJ74DRAFT_765941 [Hyaloraphidium curvatum]